MVPISKKPPWVLKKKKKEEGGGQGREGEGEEPSHGHEQFKADNIFRPKKKTDHYLIDGRFLIREGIWK